MLNGQFHVSIDLPCLNGHFPGRPILPAVHTIELAVDWLRVQTQRPCLELEEVKNAKFSAPIEPGQDVLVEAREIAATEWQLDLRQASGRDLASLRLSLIER